jgi:hypothetical protein
MDAPPHGGACRYDAGVVVERHGHESDHLVHARGRSHGRRAPLSHGNADRPRGGRGVRPLVAARARAVRDGAGDPGRCRRTRRLLPALPASAASSGWRHRASCVLRAHRGDATASPKYG